MTLWERITLGTIALTLLWTGWGLIRGLRAATTPQEKELALLKWLELVKNLAPFILASVPGVPPVLIPAIVQGISVAEAIPGANGAAKKAAVLQEIAIGLQTTNAIRPGTIDTVSVLGAVNSGIDATVNAINAIHTVNNAPPPPAPTV
jgi:hypothetical protein